MIRFLAAHDFPYLFSETAKSLLTWPWLWQAKDHDGLGVFSLPTFWGWPQEIIYGLLANVGIDWSVITLFWGIILVEVLGWISMGKLLSSYGLSRQSVLIGRLVFGLNTYLLLLVDGGQLSLALAYSLLPLVIYTLPQRLSFITVVLAISILDIRILFLVGILVVVNWLFNLNKIKHYLVLGILSLLVLVGWHGYWLMPSFLSRVPTLPATYTRSSQVGFLSFAEIGHSLNLYQPHWPKNVFGQTNTAMGFFLLLPLLAMLPLVIYKKNSQVAFWATVAILSVFLAKGSNPPLLEVYQWLFAHVPGFSLFRDPTKFFFLIAVAYSVLWAFSTDFLQKKFKYAPLGLGLYLVLLIWPVYTGQMTGIFSQPRHTNDYQALADYLAARPEGRIVWVPQKPPLGYSDPTHLSTNAVTLTSRRPFAVGIVGAYDTLNFLREATYSGELLQSAGFKYIAFAAPDPLRDSQKPEDLAYKKIFPSQIQAQPWVKSRTDFGGIALLELSDPNSLFYLADKTEFIVGSDNIYPATDNLSKAAFVFVDEYPGLLARINEFPAAKLGINGYSLTGAAAALVPQSSFVFPASNLNFSPNNTGWWKRETADIISWRDFLKSKYDIDNSDFDFGGGWAVAEGEKELKVAIPPCSTKCTLLLRSLSSPRGGKLEIDTNKLVGAVYTQTNDVVSFMGSTVTWAEVGEIGPNESAVTIKSFGDINVVNALAVVDTQTWTDYRRAVGDMATKSNVPPQSANVTWVEHNPTRYTVTVTGLAGPAVLVFGQNYDSLWSLDGHPAIPINSWLNGFSIPGSGDYTVEYLGQKYVWPGLGLTGVTLVVLTWLWISRRPLNLPH